MPGVLASSGLVVLIALAPACGSIDGGTDDEPPAACPVVDAGHEASVPALSLPPPGGSFDYQIDEPYPVPAGVSVVSRDGRAAPAPGVYNICYVNAFQSQRDSDWSGARADLLLRDQGNLVEDSDWPGEYLFDLSTADKRARLAEIVGGWIEQCAAAGFQAVELDNLDSFTRAPRSSLSVEDAAAYAKELVQIAHARALAVAQKNAAEWSECFRSLGFDFAVTEDCWKEEECSRYTSAYGDRVYDVEYDDAAFKVGCSSGETPAPILRDEQVSAPGPDYVREQCEASGNCAFGEPNDARETATPIDLNRDYTGLCVGAAGDPIDFFEMTAPSSDGAGGVVQVQVRNVGNQAAEFEVWSASDHDRVLDVYTTTAGANLDGWFTVVPGARYLISVHSFSGTASKFSYDLQLAYTPLADAFEPNGTRDQAASIVVGTPVTASAAVAARGVRAEPTETSDWYSVTLAPGSATILVSNVPGDSTCDVTAFGLDGTELGERYNLTQGADCKLELDGLLEAGAYSIQFRGFDDPPRAGSGAELPRYASGQYRLLVTQP